MDNSTICCPVCTLFLREGVTLQAHLETHPKEQVIEALLKVSNGGTATQTSCAPASSSSYVPVQSISNSNPACISQPPQTLLSINPQSQMTTAVTYQQFMTSNGATVMPQYIQVPVMSSGGSVPLFSNPMNLVPNQTVNYSQTAFNPLYNPYIPQPYPFTQPVFTNFPMPTFPVVDSNTQTSNSNSSGEDVGTVVQSSVLVKKCSVSTNTDVDKKVTKVKCKKMFVKKSASHQKFRLIKQKPTTSTSKISSTVIKPKISAASTCTNTGLISPPPLTVIMEKTTSLANRVNATPPPLKKAPNIDVVTLDSVGVMDSGGPSKVNCSVLKTKPSLNNNNEKPNCILDSGSVIKSSNNTIYSKEQEEEEEEEEHEQNKNSIVIENGCAKDSFELVMNETHEEFEAEGDELDEGDETIEENEKIFQIFEVTEESKHHVGATTNQDIPEEISSENIERNCDGSDIFIQQENIVFNDDSQREAGNENSYTEFVDVQTIEPLKNQQSGKEIQAEFDLFNDGVENSNSKQLEPQPVTYTDLKPAKNSRVFQDLGISTYLNYNNFMEVDGIKIFFNNNTANLPFDPVVKLTNVQTNGRNIPAIIKAENEVNNRALVDSVIQMVPGDNESKNDLAFSATTSKVNDIHLDLPDLSPLALNIQADESMPARGELSEQESLGAENSSWNLFHGSNISETKILEEWKNAHVQYVSEISNQNALKTYKCSKCNEVFSCPKERRVHKNAVHSNKTEKLEKAPSVRKPKTYACSFCNVVFGSLPDRKIHLFRNHLLELKNKRTNEIKAENGECVNIEGASVKNENVQENGVKTEQAIVSSAEVEPHNIKYCSRCRLPFVGVKKFREHLRLVHGEVRYKCGTCSACFDEEHEYNNHLLVHPLTCEKCGKTFHKKPNLALHMKRHLEVKPYECTLCPKSFITRQKLEEHLNGHSGKKPLKCSFCDKTFSRHSNLVQHRNFYHLNIRKKMKDFVCRCGEVFHSLRKLEWHKEVHDPKPKPCPFCSQKFIHSASVTRHIRRAHLPDYLPGDNRELDNVQCPICEKMYLRSSLAIHMRVHNGEKPFTCKICNKRFSTKWNLELHNWTHQSRSNMPFKCTLCKSAFFRESDYVAHINSHKNYKPFTCNVCGQKFIRKYSCLRHQEEHRKSKQYVCGVEGCGKSFHRGYYLRDHMKVHTGVRPHTCHICGKASSTKSNHNKHVRIHDAREPVNTEN